jgi:hypothetical protein
LESILPNSLPTKARQMVEFISITEIDNNTLPIKVGKSTIYRWRSRYPELFKKVGGKVFVNIQELINLMEKGE